MPNFGLVGKDLVGYGTATVGVTAAALSGSILESSSIALKASPDNADTIWIGSDSSVAEDDGYPLAPGESLVVPAKQLAAIFAISGTAAQSLHYLVAGR